MKKLPNDKEIIEIAKKEYSTSKIPFQITKDKVALLVVDMQEEFVNPGGKLWVPNAYKQINSIKNLIETFRKLKLPVIFSAHVHHPDGLDKGLMFDEWPKIRNGALKEGTKGVEIYSEIGPLPNEKIIFKHRYSAFYNTDLELTLRNIGVDTIVICGTMTNYCCLSTAIDAFSRDFKVVFGSDVNSMDNDEIQDSILKTIRRGFGRVLSCEEIIKIIEEGEQ